MLRSAASKAVRFKDASGSRLFSVQKNEKGNSRMNEINVCGNCGGMLQLFGRIDTDIENGIKLVWPGSYVKFYFDGTSLSVKINNFRFWNGKYIGAVIDGEEKKIELADGEQTVHIASNLADDRHEAIIYKRMAGHYFDVEKIILDDGAKLLEPDPLPEKKIEFYGDSVTAGDLVDYDDCTGKPDPAENDGSRDNSWHTYAMICARELPAQVYNTSQGGIAIFDGTGYFEMPSTKGLESCYDKLRYCSGDKITNWDFSRFVPHVIVFAVGQNDSSVGNDKIYDPEYRDRWETRYMQIINSVRSHSPKAAVVLALTLMGHDSGWDNAIEEIKNRLGGEENGVYHLRYKRAGKATPGHPRNAEQREMADELIEFLNSLPQNIWQN